MSIHAVSSSPLVAFAAGVSAQFDAQLLGGVLEAAGVLDPEIAQAVDSMALEGRQLTQAGVALTKNSLLGTLIDVLG